MKIKQYIKNILKRFGYNIVVFSPDSHLLTRRKKIIQHQKIDILLDIGANEGQYAQVFREEINFKGKIISFEPTQNAFKQLEINAKKDTNWDVYNFALGDCLDKKQINICDQAHCSSFLDMSEKFLDVLPESKYIDKETIDIKTLDSIWDDLGQQGNNICMKIDTQGFEYQVLQGALNSLKHIRVIQIEMSLVPLYKGETLFEDMLAIMKSYGYTLIALEPGFSDQTTGYLLQVDGIFCREI